MLKMENIRPYAEDDLDRIIPRKMDLKVLGEGYKERIKRNIQASETLTIEKDGHILAITGLGIVIPGMAEIWSITGVAANKFKLMFASASVLIIDFWINKHNLHRLQANVYSKHTDAIKLIEWLGFEYEGTMKKFGFIKENFYLYARTR
jgi:RimJ/RimL family protein N-acetyltransferase